METFLKALEKTPEMLALIAVVWIMMKLQTEARREYLKQMDEIHKENITAREMAALTTKENTASNIELTSAVRMLADKVRANTSVILENTNGKK